jgi:hypothetical protein
MNIFEKIIKKTMCKKDGYKFDSITNKCIKMSSEERKNRSKGAKVSAKKRKPKMSLILKKAKRTKERNLITGVKKIVKKV